MIYIVEIANQRGQKATKEYEVTSAHELYGKVQRELRDYPKLSFIGAWEKGQPSRSIFFDLGSSDW